MWTSDNKYFSSISHATFGERTFSWVSGIVLRLRCPIAVTQAVQPRFPVSPGPGLQGLRLDSDADVNADVRIFYHVKKFLQFWFYGFYGQRISLLSLLYNLEIIL